MRILVVCQYFWPESFRINDLSFKLASRGHQVEVFTGLPNYPKGRLFDGYSLLGPYTENKNGVVIKRVPLIPRFSGKGWQLALNYLSFLITGTVGVFFRAKRADVILIYQLSPVTQAIPAVFFGKIFRIPIFFYIQDLWPDSLVATGATNNKLILYVIRTLVVWLYRSSDLILTQSKSFISSVSEYGIVKEKIQYLPNSAEDFYKPIEKPASVDPISFVPPGFRVMFAGNIGKAQDFNTILGAAERLKSFSEIKFVIVGDGREREWLQNQIISRRLEQTFFWIGSHPATRMPEFFSSADVMLVTLKNEVPFARTIPSKIQSYMACEKPIIASLPGEGSFVIRESGAGIAVDPERPEALAEAILKMSKMTKSELLKMGKQGREYFDREFSNEVLVQKLESWMQQA